PSRGYRQEDRPHQPCPQARETGHLQMRSLLYAIVPQHNSRAKRFLAKRNHITTFIGLFLNMTWLHVGTFLAMGQAPAPAGTQADPRGQALTTIGMLVIMVVMFYFVLIRPQSRKAKEHDQMLKTVKAGDKIVTTGGVVGVIITVKEKTLSIRSADAKFE